VKIAIVAHLDRITQAEKLAETVKAEYIAYDAGALGCEGNHRQVWEWQAENADDWAIVLEDDAIPVQGFRSQLERALEVAPSPVVSLYLGRERPPQHQAAIQKAINTVGDAAWIISPYLLHAVGIAIRADLIPSMLDWTSNMPLPQDEKLGWWARKNHIAISYTWPSLVDHADGPPVAKHQDKMERTPGRTAWKASAREAWTDKAVVM
jgi:GR25 family glycosyltransferase involved in LPS biosynthesis